MVALNARRTALGRTRAAHMAISAQKRPATLRGFSQAQRVRNSFLLRPTAATMGQPRCPVPARRISAFFSQARRARARRFQSIPHHSVSHGSSTQHKPLPEHSQPQPQPHTTRPNRRAPQPHATVQRRSQPSAPPAIRPLQSPDASTSPSADPDAATCRRRPFRRPPRPRSSPTSPCPSTSRTRSTPHGQRGPQPRRRCRRCLRTTPSTPCPKSSRYITRAAPYDQSFKGYVFGNLFGYTEVKVIVDLAMADGDNLAKTRSVSAGWGEESTLCTFVFS